MKKSAIATAVALGLSVVSAHAVQVPTGMVPAGSTNLVTDRANFTMIDPAFKTFGGSNDVAMAWDGTVFTDITDYTSDGVNITATANVTASSATTFFGSFAHGTFQYLLYGTPSIVPCSCGLVQPKLYKGVYPKVSSTRFLWASLS